MRTISYFIKLKTAGVEERKVLLNFIACRGWTGPTNMQKTYAALLSPSDPWFLFYSQSKLSLLTFIQQHHHSCQGYSHNTGPVQRSVVGLSHRINTLTTNTRWKSSEFCPFSMVVIFPDLSLLCPGVSALWLLVSVSVSSAALPATIFLPMPSDLAKVEPQAK